jgi:UDP-N-acetylmuramate dehydrogenase
MINYNNIANTEFIKSCDLTKYTTMRVKAVGDLIIIKSVKALKEVLSDFKEQKQEFRILGWGANQILPSETSSPYIKLDLEYDINELEVDRKSYVIPASVSLGKLSALAMRKGLIGWEVFTGIPATVGGAVFMNAGTNLGEIGPLIKKVWLITASGEDKLIECDSSSFSYRKNNFTNKGDVIYQIEITNNGQSPAVAQKIKDYLDLRKRTQPLKEPTCGCVFKNYVENDLTCRAGQIIDIIGLKGLTSNGLKISHKHGNFIENHGNATGDEAVSFIESIKKEILLNTGLCFEIEVQIS